jgi:hypothetical protein
MSGEPCRHSYTAPLNRFKRLIRSFFLLWACLGRATRQNRWALNDRFVATVLEASDDFGTVLRLPSCCVHFIRGANVLIPLSVPLLGPQSAARYRSFSSLHILSSLSLLLCVPLSPNRSASPIAEFLFPSAFVNPHNSLPSDSFDFARAREGLRPWVLPVS